MSRTGKRVFTPLLIVAACMLGCTTEEGVTGSPHLAETANPEPVVTPTLSPAPSATPMPTPTPTATPVVVPSAHLNPTLPPDLQPTEPPATTSMDAG